MLYWSLLFLILALASAALGFAALSGLAATISKVLFVVFLVGFVIGLLESLKSSKA